jgi:hypothetical protein
LSETAEKGQNVNGRRSTLMEKQMAIRVNQRSSAAKKCNPGVFQHPLSMGLAAFPPIPLPLQIKRACRIQFRQALIQTRQSLNG